MESICRQLKTAGYKPDMNKLIDKSLEKDREYGISFCKNGEDPVVIGPLEGSKRHITLPNCTSEHPKLVATFHTHPIVDTPWMSPPDRRQMLARGAPSCIGAKDGIECWYLKNEETTKEMKKGWVDWETHTRAANKMIEKYNKALQGTIDIGEVEMADLEFNVIVARSRLKKESARLEKAGDALEWVAKEIGTCVVTDRR